MIDSLGRKIEYLRLSVTQRCNLNCTYCGRCKENTYEMTQQEIAFAVSCFAKCGIKKVRLTGGEPLVRGDIIKIAHDVSHTLGIEKTAITTNGILLPDFARELKKAGINGVNISLDTTDEKQYKAMTGADAFGRVLKGIEASLDCDFDFVRINAVLIKDVNDNQAESLIRFAKENRADVRFIELMPFSSEGENSQKIVTGKELLERFDFLRPIDKISDKSQPAKYYTAEGFMGRVGFINPISDKFCSRCNRIRMMCDGKIKPCLGSDTVFDGREYLLDEDKFINLIEKAAKSKAKGHTFECGYGAFHGLNKTGG